MFHQILAQSKISTMERTREVFLKKKSIALSSILAHDINCRIIMDRSKEIFEITKIRLGLRFDCELADLLGIKKSTLSQRISRGDFPFFQIRQLLNERQIDANWLEEYEDKMPNTDSSQSMNQESARLKDKDQIIQIQQDYIENLKQQLKELREEHKKKSIPANAPELFHQLNPRTHLIT